ncbi:MAG: VWA domain-containing protein [Granulosicoccaceae bacterium]
MNDISWLWPWAWLILPLPIVVYFLHPKRFEKNSDALLVPDIGLFVQLAGGGHGVSRGSIAPLLLAFCWLALTAALARPQSIGEPISVPLSGRDLMLCIDISGSMGEQDLYQGNSRVTRMAIVKTVASDFIERRSADRVGLILFGSQAYVQTPLTTDHKTVQEFLEEATIGLAGRKTAIGDALGLGVKRLRERAEESKVLILLTDGANSAGVVTPTSAARLAAEEGIRIYSIGIGSEQQTSSIFGVPMASRGSELDEASLRSIAEISGGKYFRARNQRELQNIYKEIDRLEPNEVQTDDFRRVTELYVWPLAFALLLFIVYLLTGIAKPILGVNRG